MRLLNDTVRVAASDLANFLACRHLTKLDLARLRGDVQPIFAHDLGFENLVERGEQHEQAILTDFKNRGWTVHDLKTSEEDRAQGAEATAEAIKSGVDAIYQGTLIGDGELGLPDFLVRADLLRDGASGYEVIDAKLARTAKARAVLQSAFYSRLLSAAQGSDPEYLHLALGTKEMPSFRVRDYAAYERQVSRMLKELIAEGDTAFPILDPYPEPNEHCAICRWRPTCESRRREDDDLSLIAGISSRQRAALKAGDISTRRGFAALEDLPKLDRVSAPSLRKVHLQARIQVKGEDEDKPLWEFVDPERTPEGELEPNRGLLVLPERAEGDLFFDIEGARYYSEDAKTFSLQYLFGIVDTADLDETGKPRYHAWWAFDRAGERRAFEQVVDFLASRLAARPAAHVYHYNHYEPTTMEHLSELHMGREDVLRELMGRYASREDEIDHLLRRQVFVDLYRVVRQGVRVSEESYSIKRLERHIGYVRAVDLHDVNARMVAFDAAMDDGTAKDELESQRLIQGYNEDDCRSTLLLRDWLEARREDLEAELGAHIPRPTPPEVEEEEVDPEVAALREALLSGVPADPMERDEVQQARALMADLLEFNRREARPQWWRYYYLKGLTDDELLLERDAVAGLQFAGEAGPLKKSTLFRYTFPPQEHSFDNRASVEDPRTGGGWSIYEIDDAAGWLTLVRGPSRLEDPHPTALTPPEPQYRKITHTASIRALAQRCLAEGDFWPRSPAFDLLLRRRPNADGRDAGDLRRTDEEGSAAGRRLALGLDQSSLSVQGPPGTGKTYTGAWQILDLVNAGKRVGVTAMSHAVICNLLDEVAKQAELHDLSIRIGQKPGDDPRFINQAAMEADRIYGSNAGVKAALQSKDVDVVGGTSWLWSHPDLEGAVDVLVFDEAGQLSLADVLACCRAAASVILLGDPMQLAQPSQAAHPEGSDVSALEQVLSGETTMPDDRGLFIDRTRRMHPDICDFTSEVFYDDRLKTLEGLEHQALLGEGHLSRSGLRAIEVAHEGNANSSPEEADVVVALLRDVLGRRWLDKEEVEHELGSAEVLVVTPFNAQIRVIEDALEEAGLAGVRVGTVDKFQGRQAPVVIYSMASSTAHEAARGMEFLYDLHRLNVATSRAQCLAVVVGSPELVRAICRTPRQMVLANALCRFKELVSA